MTPMMCVRLTWACSFIYSWAQIFCKINRGKEGKKFVSSRYCKTPIHDHLEFVFILPKLLREGVSSWNGSCFIQEAQRLGVRGEEVTTFGLPKGEFIFELRILLGKKKKRSYINKIGRCVCILIIKLWANYTYTLWD